MMKYQIKLVPDNQPNADGKWVDVPECPPRGMKFGEYETFYAAHIPEGLHLVAIQTISQ
jgi:uncharacterized protein YeaO (DUF488 family)